MKNKLSKIVLDPVLILALVGGLAVRISHLSASNIWHDEGYSLMLAPYNITEILVRTARDVHPPLYYIVLHFWMLLFGASEIAVRGLSIIFGLIAVAGIYLIVKRLAGQNAARWAAVLATAGPFLVRYSQEARMYAMVAALIVLATYFILLAEEDSRWFYAYGVVAAAALYTHYYSIFALLAHWIYIAWRYFARGVDNRPKFFYRWWLGNVVAGALFLPWVPKAIGQFSRVQAGFWIPRVNDLTLPNTLAQFMAFTNFDNITRMAKFLIIAVWLGALMFALRKPKNRRPIALLLPLVIVAPVMVFLLSFARPIYIDRYFVFASVAFYALLGWQIGRDGQSKTQRRIASLIGVAVLAMFAWGISNVYAQANHRMKAVADYVNSNYTKGDEVISGELYSYFDFSYYNYTGQTLKLLAPKGFSGYGETSLLYDREDEIAVKSYSDIRPQSGRVWIVGKTGQHDYFTKIPANWQASGDRVVAGSSAVQLYQIGQ